MRETEHIGMWKSESTGVAHVEEAVKQFLPPCEVKCPVKEDIQRTNVLISLLPEDPNLVRGGVIQIGDYLYEKNPFFNICGYICGLCELECNYKIKGGAIRRRLLKRFLSDFAYTDYLSQKEEFDIVKDKENVAVVGGGPGGLMCAYTLSKKGYRVTIFEASNRLGGALWLIPDYRLPKEILKTTIDNLVRITGIDVKYEARVGEERLTFERLKKDGYKAVFLAKGTPSPRVLTFDGEMVEGQDLSGVIYGQNFLYEVSRGDIEPDYLKERRVIVIGGGNVAFDVARSARRLGGEVTIVCLEAEDKTSRDGIPADDEEIRGAWEEGIRIIYSRGVGEIVGEGGRFEKLSCPRCTSVFDEEGFNPQFDCSDCTDLAGDVLIITVGQIPDRAFLQREGLLDERGRLAVDPFTLQSLTKDWVFIGGDVRKIGFMVDAMHEGAFAAESIERYLRGLDMREGRKKDYEGYDAPIRKTYKPEPDAIWIPPEKRMHFQVFEKGFTLKEAIEEAKRCLHCGPCISCKACVSIGFEKSLYAVEVDKEKCSGCGICTYACNYGSAQLIDLEGKRISTTDMFKCKSCGMCVVACPSNARRMVEDRTEERIEEVYAAL
ncbi:MAG: 4Fe-4S domain-binding protein [Candidatus Methanolliviera sp. GoM_oil]|nr:MAG: 4Fe-4S domain-binding protein [Candidatus Methanolliviera sp. GoM_oil]